jgi:hypothetical protein
MGDVSNGFKAGAIRHNIYGGSSSARVLGSLTL